MRPSGRCMGKMTLSVVAVFLATLCLTSLGQGSMGTLGQIKAREDAFSGRSLFIFTACESLLQGKRDTGKAGGSMEAIKTIALVACLKVWRRDCPFRAA